MLFFGFYDRANFLNARKDLGRRGCLIVTAGEIRHARAGRGYNDANGTISTLQDNRGAASEPPFRHGSHKHAARKTHHSTARALTHRVSNLVRILNLVFTRVVNHCVTVLGSSGGGAPAWMGH
jgi:hypothetical protein